MLNLFLIFHQISGWCSYKIVKSVCCFHENHFRIMETGRRDPRIFHESALESDPLCTPAVSEIDVILATYT